MKQVSYRDWFEVNVDWLEEDYTIYCDDCLEEHKRPDDFEDYCLDMYESYLGDIEDEAYQRYKDEGF